MSLLEPLWCVEKHFQHTFAVGLQTHWTFLIDSKFCNVCALGLIIHRYPHTHTYTHEAFQLVSVSVVWIWYKFVLWYWNFLFCFIKIDSTNKKMCETRFYTIKMLGNTVCLCRPYFRRTWRCCMLRTLYCYNILLYSL